MDNYYTPVKVASLMIDAVHLPIGASDTIADFAAGTGALLEAAQLKWPEAKIVASDIDSKIIRLLKKKKYNWQICSCDFLNPNSTNNSLVLRKLIGNTKLVLINPPFSNRGGKRVSAKIGKVNVKCSIGMAFFVNSANFLAIGGELIGILPLGVLTSERDEEAWEILKEFGEIITIKYNGDNVFHKATVQTAVIKFVRKQLQPINRETFVKNADILSKSTVEYRLIRGSTQMDSIKKAKGTRGTY